MQTRSSRAANPASPRTPASDLPAARAPQGSPLWDKAATASPQARGASSPGLLSLPRPRLRPKAPPGRRGSGGDPGPGSRSPRPASPPPLTCSALCGSSGVRQPGRRRTGYRRRRRCPRPAGSRWWSPHGSAGPAAAAAAAAAAARGGSSRRRRRRGGDQNAAGRIVRRLGPGNAQRTRPGGRGPGRRCCLRSGEAGRYPPLRPPPPPSPPLTPLPSRCASPSPSPPSPAPALPEPCLQVLAHPAKWPGRGSRAAAELPVGSVDPHGERGWGSGLCLLSRLPGLLGASGAVVLAPPQPVPRSLGKLPSVSHGVRDRE